MQPAGCPAVHSFFFSCYGRSRGLHSFPTRRSSDLERGIDAPRETLASVKRLIGRGLRDVESVRAMLPYELVGDDRSEEHTSELQSRRDLVCRLLLEKKNTHDDVKAADLRQHNHPTD